MRQVIFFGGTMKKIKSNMASVLILGGIGTLAINSNNSTVDARNM